MTKLIARREELKQLRLSTNNYDDIAKCKSLEDYEKLIKTVKKVPGFDNKQTKGLVFGEPFLNFFFIEHGPTLNVDFVRMATKDEDYNEGFDVLLQNRLTGKYCRANHKMYEAYKEVSMVDSAGLGWSAAVTDRDWTVMIVTTSNTLSLSLATKLTSANGERLLRIDIEPLVKQSIFWVRFAEYLRQNVIEWAKVESEAAAKALLKCNRQLDPAQTEDLIKLKEEDRGISIRPAGSGKTSLEAKLIEYWMEEHSGPIIFATRVRDLAGQVLSELVELNKFSPERIACWSTKDHPMDIREPLFAGTLDDDLEEIIRDCYALKKNVIIGSVIDHGSVPLLKFLRNEGFPVRIIIDECAEAISGKENDAKAEKKTETTLNELYELNSANLIQKLHGFDAVWKHGPYRGMNDATLWHHDEWIVMRTQSEMTYEYNVLCPIEIVFLEVEPSDLTTSNNPDIDPDRQLELAGFKKAAKHQMYLQLAGEQRVAKIVDFCSSKEVAWQNTLEHRSLNMDVNEVVLSGTSPDRRREIQHKLMDRNTISGVISNHSIWIKGIDVQDLTGVALGYQRQPSEENLTHMIGRAARRAPGERGLPLDECVDKKVGIFYVPYLKNKSLGGEGAQTVKALYEKLYTLGYTDVDIKFVRTGTSKKPDPIEPVFVEDPNVFESVPDEDLDKIEINRTLSVIRAKLVKQEVVQEIKEEKANIAKDLQALDLWS